jgi:flavin-binding protein dodecin
MAIARVTEITASSPSSFEEAITEGFARAAKTLRGITGLEVERMTAHVENNKIAEYRVRMKVTFILED